MKESRKVKPLLSRIRLKVRLREVLNSEFQQLMIVGLLQTEHVNKTVGEEPLFKIMYSK